MWQPTASIEVLKKRAQLMAATRQFFEGRGFWEVETPLLMPSIGTDVVLQPFQVHSVVPKSPVCFLQTSPEFAMKRLLAMDCGPIYQLCKAFRDEEKGRYHNFEFTMLEWYHPGFSLEDCIAETLDLLSVVCGWPQAEIVTYQSLFETHCGFCPHTASLEVLQTYLRSKEIVSSASLVTWSREDCLQCILSHFIEPVLGFEAPVVVKEFPAAQAALACIVPREGFDVAERFEIYVRGIELANGYHELTDPIEQKRRFDKDNQARQQQGLPVLPIDYHLIDALQAGVPDCSGVALGFDRLVMLALEQTRLQDVQSFYHG